MDKREEMIVKNLPLVSFVVGKMSDESGSSVIDREDARTRGAIFSLVGLAFCAIGLAGFYLR